MTIHYCPKHKSIIKDRIRKTCFIARTIWWSNPRNPTDRRWYCLKCVKARSDKKFFPSKWYLEDINIIKSCNRFAPKRFKQDYRLEIHHQEQKKNRLDKHIKSYIKTRNSALQNITRDHDSCFHNEPVRDDGYLRTAVLTALMVKDPNPSRMSRGGRPSEKGAKSIRKICSKNFIHEIPKNLTDRICDKLNPGKYVGAIKIKFNERKIRLILKEQNTKNTENNNRQR
jgi:hypothetical protein